MAIRKRDERGAYAILFAMLAVFLMSIAAFAVDIGNAVRASRTSRAGRLRRTRRGAQLAGRQRGAIPTTVLDAVRLSMNENQPVNRNGACVADYVPASPATLS